MKTLRMLIAFTACSCAVWAQADAHRGSISGSIVDPNQAVIPGVKVVASNQNTGLVRETVSNDAGQYRFAALDAGLYTVKATAEGFAEFTARDVVLAVGSSVQLNLNVSLEATVQSIEVGATIIQVQETNSSQIVDQTAIRDLPINGRRFQDFATLSPMVQADSRTRGQLSFAGQRGINSNVMIDGSDYNEPFFGGIRGGERSIFAFTVPQSAIQEFQVVSSGYAPEYGRSTGGILNTVTRSGANDYHGDLFYQLRHKELGLKNPLNQQSLETQHQYGGGIGGPIKRDKLFFFGAFEQQFADFPRLVRFAALDQITNVTPDIAPAYNYYKSLEGPFAQTNDVAAALGRVDYQFDNGSRLTGRYNYSRNEAQNAVTTGTSLNPQTNTALSNNGTEGNNTHTVLGQYTSILSPTTVNDLRVQFSREARPRSSNSEQVNVTTTIGQFGTRNFLPTDANNSRFQIADSLSMQKGRHSLKIGFDYSYIDVFQTFGFNQFGLFSIGGSDVARHLRILSGVSGNRFDDSLVVFRRQIGNLTLGTTAQQLAFFAQDNWRVTDRFTLNYGLRWEGQFNPEPESNNDFLVQNVRNFAYPLGTTDPTKIRDQFDQWAPRVGFAWNPMGDNKTVIRAQTGFYYAQSPVILYA
ncbi:MAG: TonB-dependent receptor, partial [Bryobacterales bacterium]|nr:TonB-dependent receptor [Bryobacterales bacterium]